MIGFIEVTSKITSKRRLINADYILEITEQQDGAYIVSKAGSLAVKEDFDQVKKLLGYVITPRAETIMMK